jgi:hypothetical protein
VITSVKRSWEDREARARASGHEQLYAQLYILTMVDLRVGVGLGGVYLRDKEKGPAANFELERPQRHEARGGDEGQDLPRQAEKWSKRRYQAIL